MSFMHEDLLRDSRRLAQYGVLCASGPDVRSFLQGQLSVDLATLAPATALLASCNSAQGRVQAVLWLVDRGDEVALLTSAELTESLAARLRKYVLRAKVRLEASTLSVYGTAAQEEATVAAWTAPFASSTVGAATALRWPGNRTLWIAPTRETIADDGFARAWQLADLRSGVPIVLPQTHERFVAQMLNLDLLGGISFDKGCYTGQEIIARTHYRGNVKRRMLRYAVTGPAPQPGTRVLAGAEAAGEVVIAAATAEGAELLAVIQLSHVEQPLTLDGCDGVLQRLPLPYTIPTAD